jgi:hypothetical protein
MAGISAGVSAHGIGILANNANNPLQIRGNGGSDLAPDPEFGYYGSNKQDNTKNAKELYKNMGYPERLEGYQAHHIVPGTSKRPAAVEARQILEEFGIDINQTDNGVMIPGDVNRKLNDPNYEIAVLKVLREARDMGRTKEDIIYLLQDIGNQILATGTYP